MWSIRFLYTAPKSTQPRVPVPVYSFCADSPAMSSAGCVPHWHWKVMHRVCSSACLEKAHHLRITGYLNFLSPFSNSPLREKEEGRKRGESTAGKELGDPAGWVACPLAGNVTRQCPHEALLLLSALINSKLQWLR